MPGYRWAPRSLLTKFHKDVETSPIDGSQIHIATVSETGGLTFCSPGYVLEPARVPLARHLFAGIFPYAIVRATSLESLTPDQWLQVRYIQDELEKPELREDERVAVVLDQRVNDSGTIGVLIALTGGEKDKQAAVDAEAGKGKLIGRFVCRVRVTCMFAGYEEVFRFQAAKKHVEDFQSQAVEVDEVEWLIL